MLQERMGTEMPGEFGRVESKTGYSGVVFGLGRAGVQV
jgi:hypothetical protein